MCKLLHSSFIIAGRGCELLMALQCWDFRHLPPSLVYMMLESKTRAWYKIGKHIPSIHLQFNFSLKTSVLITCSLSCSYFMCKGVSPACVTVHHMCDRCPQRPECGIGSLGARVTDCNELTWWGAGLTIKSQRSIQGS